MAGEHSANLNGLNGTPMEVDEMEETDGTVPSPSTSTSNTNRSTPEPEIGYYKDKDAKRKKLNKMSRLGNTSIHYCRDSDSIIGQGFNAIVYEGFHIIPDRRAAVKCVKLEHIKIAENELKVWMSLGETGRKNVVQLYDYKKWKKHYYFAMELANCDLKKRIEKDFNSNRTKFSKEQIREKIVGYLLDIANGLEWMHYNSEKKRVVHRDIKPENILIFINKDGSETAKLADFGISRKFENNLTGTVTLGQGTQSYMSPEAINASNHGVKFYTTPKIDIFGFGLTAYYAMSRGMHPFKISKKYGKNAQMNIWDPDTLPSSLLDDLTTKHEHSADHLFQWMMSHLPDERPKIYDVLKHPFFWSPKKCLSFLIEVALAFERGQGDENVPELRNSLNSQYSRLYKEYDSRYRVRKFDINSSFIDVDWSCNLGDDLFQRLRGNFAKVYHTNQIMSLVELIRDKQMHYQTLDRELTRDEYFGENDIFSKEKYASVFLEKFPYLIIFLYTSLSKECKEFPFLNTLKKEYKLEIGIPPLPPLRDYLKDEGVKYYRSIDSVLNWRDNI